MGSRVTVVTGGYGGMGMAVAQRMGPKGPLVLAGRDKAKLAREVDRMEELGYEAHAFTADVRNREQVEGLAGFSASFGEVANVVHTAGVSPTSSDAETIIATNGVGTAHMIDAFYHVMATGGTMVNIASMAAYAMTGSLYESEAFDTIWDSPDLADRLMDLVDGPADDEFVRGGMAYCISKAFAVHLSKKNTVRFAEKGCRIVSISPGTYLTPMQQELIDTQPDVAENMLELIPRGRWGHPYEIAELVAFLCSPGAGYITGIDILADGGQISNTYVDQV